MAVHRRRFSREFKLNAVRQALESDRTGKEVAEELGIGSELLYRWMKQLMKQFRIDSEQSFRGHGKLKERDKEVDELRRELERLRAENIFLK